MESVIAAVYLDGGIEAARRFVRQVVLPVLLEGATAGYDYKTALQELVQRKSGQTLSYHLTGESGPDHSKQFFVEVQLNGVQKGTGSGKSKKEAEQAAAKAALDAMTP
jgi:ribonuclease-3